MGEDEAPTVSFDELDAGGVSGYRVTRAGIDIGTVRPFRLAAGQFGGGWMAEDRAGERSTGFPSREAAADWLNERAGG